MARDASLHFKSLLFFSCSKPSVYLLTISGMEKGCNCTEENTGDQVTRRSPLSMMLEVKKTFQVPGSASQVLAHNVPITCVTYSEPRFYFLPFRFLHFFFWKISWKQSLSTLFEAELSRQSAWTSSFSSISWRFLIQSILNDVRLSIMKAETPD